MAEYNTYNHVHDFLDECEIKDSSAYSPDGKLRKVLFIGFDGMRADALPYVLQNENNEENTAYNSVTDVSAIKKLQQTGVYISHIAAVKPLLKPSRLPQPLQAGLLISQVYGGVSMV